MGFASEVRTKVTIGEDEYQIRKLSGHSLDKARMARSIEQAHQLRAMGGEITKALRSEDLDKVSEAMAAKRESRTLEERAKERYAEYDHEEVLNAGIVSWSHAKDVSRQAINDLDQEAWDGLHREILDHSLGPLEGEDPKAEAGSGASTSF